MKDLYFVRKLLNENAQKGEEILDCFRKASEKVFSK